MSYVLFFNLCVCTVFHVFSSFLRRFEQLNFFLSLVPHNVYNIKYIKWIFFDESREQKKIISKKLSYFLLQNAKFMSKAGPIENWKHNFQFVVNSFFLSVLSFFGSPSIKLYDLNYLIYWCVCNLMHHSCPSSFNRLNRSCDPLMIKRLKISQFLFKIEVNTQK